MKILLGLILIIVSTYLTSIEFRKISLDSKELGYVSIFVLIKELVFGLAGIYLFVFILGIILLIN